MFSRCRQLVQVGLPSISSASTCRLSLRVGHKMQRCPPRFPLRRLVSMSTTTTDRDEAFRLYEEAQTKMDELRKKAERIKSEEMFRAWERSQQAEKKGSIKGGVAVVQTLVKQSKKKPTSQIDEYKQLAEDMLQRAAELGHGQALVLLGNKAFQKAQVSKDDEAKQMIQQALDLYRRAGQAGASEGWFNYGHLLWTGYPDLSQGDADDDVPILLEPDQNTAMQAFLDAVEQGDADAMYFVGVHKLSSEDNLEDCRSGLALIEQAASQQHCGALYYLALLYLNGHDRLGIAPCTDAEFAKRLNAAAEAGDADALFLRGHCHYSSENGYEQSYRKALENFLMAADAGSADAAISAGAILVRGHPGIESDPVRAFELYQHAGELGSLDGWKNVVDCYVQGIGVPKSIDTARYISQTMLKEDLAAP